MLERLPGISGSLFPTRFLADVAKDFTTPDRLRAPGPADLIRWWKRAATTAGPATSVREVFDLVASPLAGLLGFRAREVTVGPGIIHARLDARAGGRVGLVVRPWGGRGGSSWRDVAGHARHRGLEWCWLVAPPVVSLLDCRGHGLRRAVDFTWPDTLEAPCAEIFLAVASANAFDGGPESKIAALVEQALAYQGAVRRDLEAGVATALSELGSAIPVSRGRRGRGAGPSFEERLTIVYRILFLLFAESRELVPVGHPVFERSYAVTTLCRDALSLRSTGLWDGLAAISRLSRTGCRNGDLIVRPFNGRLFARASAPVLEEPTRRRQRIATGDDRDVRLQRALVALGTRAGRHGRETISYADLGVEQLGSVYERVLDLDPAHPANVERSGRRRTGHSGRRKATGTFYTPQVLADFVVRRTLAPLVTGASADAILGLRVVDPAMGSGACLVAACRFLADAYERALIEEGRCAEHDLDETARALHRRVVAERCLAGVDSNPTAVQVAQLAVWLTSLARGRPLGFLDHRLRTGNSLIGATPEDIGLIGGRSRGGQPPRLPLLDAAGLDQLVARIAVPMGELVNRHDETVDDVKAKEGLWRQICGAESPLEPWRLASSLWCARWFWPDDAGIEPPSAVELRAAIDGLRRNDTTIDPRRLAEWAAVARRVCRDHQFFHWPLEFPDIFYGVDGRPAVSPGFDAVIGNPPWEMLRQDRDQSREAPGARRQTVDFVRQSGLYPEAGRGHVNLYLPFLERALSIVKPGGRTGLVLPWGFASDDGAAALRRRLVERGELDTVVGIDNAQGLFPVHRGLRFLVLVTGRAREGRAVRARFGLRRVDEIAALPARDDDGPDALPVRLDQTTLHAVGGRTHRIPDVRREGDLALLERLCRRWPRLGSRESVGATFGRDLNATDDRRSLGLVGLPVLEGKHVSPFVADAGGATRRIEPGEARRLLPDRRFERARLAYRDVSGVGNRITLIAAVLPPAVVTTHTLFCLREPMPSAVQHYLCGVLNSYVLNGVVRLLMGGHVTTGLVEDLPVPPWTAAPLQERIAETATRVATSIGRYATDAGPAGTSGRTTPPEAVRATAALHAMVAHLYGLDAEAFAHVLGGFPLLPPAEKTAAMAAFRSPASAFAL